MFSHFKIDYYSTLICQVRRGPSCKGEGRNKAKLLLLWSIISLVENNILSRNVITLDILRERYEEAYREFIIQKTVIIYPFYYLKNDGFWHLKWKNDKEIVIKTPSFRFFDNSIDYAYLDKEFWELLQEQEAREKIKEVLVRLIKND